MKKLAYALGQPQAHGHIRREPGDFRVMEGLGFEPDGSGEHLLVQVQKSGENTQWVARRLAACAQIRERDVGFCGMKDRNAISTQWFSLWLPGAGEPDWRSLDDESIKILAVGRHRNKLRRGAHKGNGFQITVRQLQGDRKELEGRLERIARAGFPNYFGEQRFGREMGNLAAARALFKGTSGRLRRSERGLYLSAARAWLFNLVLSARVADNSWDRPIGGDLMMLEGTHSIFAVDEVDDGLRARVAALDAHPTGPMWGRGQPLRGAEIMAREKQCLGEYRDLAAGLEAVGLRAERRALRACAYDIEWRFPGADVLELEFGLTTGSYATSLLREVVDY